MISIGTSGFSYSDWKGHFYPENIQPKDMLAFYSGHFSACEINATYYRIPSAANMEAMVKKAGGRVRFVVKAHQSMTHQRNAGSVEYRAFLEALKPMQDRGCLGAVLLQFPYAFPNTIDHRGYLADCRSQFEDVQPLVVEFRHHSWDTDAVRGFLKQMKTGIVNVDEPDIRGLLKPAEWATSNIGYIRFHGRNKADWYRKDAEPWERYNYLYQEEELEEWVPRIRNIEAICEETFIFFNNHWQSQAVVNAKQMAKMLELPMKNG